MISDVKDGLVGGLDFSIEGWGGPECFQHTSTQQKIAETGFSLSIVVAILAAHVRVIYLFFSKILKKQ